MAKPSLVPCKTCKQEVAKSAKKCPHCGAKLRMGFMMKGFLFLVGLIVLIVIISNLGGGSKDEPTTGSSSNTPKTEAPASPETLSNEGTSSNVSLRVDKFETADKVGDNQFSEAKAQGVFKVVTLSIKNGQKDVITVDSNSFKLFDKEGREFSTSSDGQMAFMGNDKMKALFLEQVNPGIEVQGVLVYDVPKDATGFYLQASGGILGKKIKLKVE